MRETQTSNSRGADRYETTLLAGSEYDGTLRHYRGNVSSGGFCLLSDREIESGTRLNIIFRLPGAGVWMAATGVVLGCVSNICSVGIRGLFTDVKQVA